MRAGRIAALGREGWVIPAADLIAAAILDACTLRRRCVLPC